MAKVAASGADHVVNCAVPEDDASQTSVPGKTLTQAGSACCARRLSHLPLLMLPDLVHSYEGMAGNLSMEMLR